MALHIYNTLSRRKEVFQPLHQGKVRIYVCGPTVYDHLHIGHAKSYVGFDVVVRYLRFSGYHVRYVQNITDVGHLTDNADAGEDKILRRAARERLEPMELVETYMRSCFEDMDALNIVRPDISPRASGHIPEQIELIRRLLEKGCAYEARGSVYFAVQKFADYGRLSGRRPEEQEGGARVDVVEEKRYPGDFALWKRAEPGHILRWPSPWGEGFPGWHIECSAMGMKYLGDTLDIHGGGLDNIFPHHEDEIAQSESATGKPFVRYWMHNNMVLVDGVRMGKSLGNFVTIKDALSRYRADAIRFFVLSSHYRSPSDFSDAALQAAEKGVARLREANRIVRAKLKDAADGPPDGPTQQRVDAQRATFVAAMDDDFNTAGALAGLFDLVRDVNALAQSGTPVSQGTWEYVAQTYEDLAGKVLGLRLQPGPKRVTPPPATLVLSTAGPDVLVDHDPEARFIELLVETRKQLREAKQWALADRVRDGLARLGIILKDGPQGTTWERQIVTRSGEVKAQ